MKRKLTTLAAGFLAIGIANPLAAGLRDESDINNGLILIEAGYQIQKHCDSISPRLIKAYRYGRSLERLARDRGYSEREIRAFVEDKGEKERVNSAANAYLLSKGLDPASPQSYCTVGQYEIDRNSQIGVLLKLK
ncbi:DUF5333 domain-containing protein [Actibacterium mucosum]|nr:DUF5333 domain-containing protein [Actibacterium mucosum]